MSRTTSPLWTIDELGAQVALCLSNEQAEMPSGRIREVPDQRTIRYYTTLGLMDRPSQMRGRTALYGERHLLQLVAIKRLQARGLPLAEIQERLLGRSDAALRKLASLPPGSDTAQAKPPPENPTEPRSGAFWTAPPQATKDDVQDSAGTDANLPWQGIPLEEGVLLLFEPGRTLDEEDLSALRAAAAPLLKLLQTRRLLRPRTERENP